MTGPSVETSTPSPPAGRPRRLKLFRWKAIVPLTLFVALVVLFVWLFLDTLVERNIEAFGADLVGARVDLESADVRLGEGSVTLTGLQVTNPDAPMRNLVEVAQIVANVRVLPLTEKKIYIDTAAVRGVRFNTQRATSGAIDPPPAANRELRRRVDEWADRVRVPEFSVEGLLRAVDVSALHPDSLQTPRVAAALVGRADSARQEWESRLRALDPRPTIDSARALVDRLQGATVATLGVQGVVQSVRSARSTLEDIGRVRERLTALDSAVRAGVGTLDDAVAALNTARANDVTRAMSMLALPSLDAPDLSPSLFGDFAVNRVRPLLYWLQVGQRYVPPGLDPRRRPGPKRPRLSGETIQFPKAGALPTFTLAYGEADLVIGGEDAAAGSYAARIEGLSSAPAVLGRPLAISAERTAAVRGPRDVRFAALFDHTNTPTRDTVHLDVAGVGLPTVSLGALGASVALGQGQSVLNLVRTGDSIQGRWIWRSSNVTWDRAVSTATGVRGQVETFLWRAISDLQDVEIEVRFSGNPRSPRLGIRSNIGATIAASLRRQLQAEITAAEQRVRAEVARLVATALADARTRVDALRTGVQQRLGTDMTALDDVRAALQARVRELTRLLPPGIRIPG